MATMIAKLGELITYKEIIKNFVTQELKVKYRRSALGFLWSLLNPILMLTVLATVFSTVLRIPMKYYAVYLFSTILPWNWVAASLQGSSGSIIQAEHFLRSNYFPKLVFPLSIVLSNMVNFLLSTVALFIVGLVIGFEVQLPILFLPISVLNTFLFVMGLSAMIAMFTVYYRDVQHLIDVFLMAWYFLSPIIYPITMVPQEYHQYFKMNPLYFVLNLYSSPIYYGNLPSMGSIIVSFIVSASVFVVGLWWFFRCEDELIFRL